MKAILITAAIIATGATAARADYALDRVYTGNQVSNTVSVIAPETNTLLGEIVLGKPYPNVLSPLYKGQSLVHGLGYSPDRKMLAVVSIGSNAVTLIDTATNKILKTIYTGRAPHEATFTPNGKEVWVTVRGEAYISVIDTEKMMETKKITVADGPGMVAFTPDGTQAYVCSSFTAVLDVVDTATYKVAKTLAVPSPFSPNIFPSPDGKYMAMTHKDLGKVSLIDVAQTTITQTIATGPVTNHVTFAKSPATGHLLMPVTVGGANAIKVYDTDDNCKLVGTIDVGVMPHGMWPAPDGKTLYINLEFSDTVQPIDLVKMTAGEPIKVGQSPQALLYARGAVNDAVAKENLAPLATTAATQTVKMTAQIKSDPSPEGLLAIRAIGLTDLIEQDFKKLTPNAAYTLALTKNADEPKPDYEIQKFTTDPKGAYKGQSTGLTKSADSAEPEYKAVILLDGEGKVILKSSE